MRFLNKFGVTVNYLGVRGLLKLEWVYALEALLRPLLGRDMNQGKLPVSLDFCSGICKEPRTSSVKGSTWQTNVGTLLEGLKTRTDFRSMIQYRNRIQF